jgi:NADH-quinone oxidoreductase subunit L
MTVVACTGVLTAIFAASIGFFQYDIKKVLAYSTVSQLGFMFIGVGVGAYWAGIFHLMTHAFFKACLFLGSGSVILACHHEQDMRKMGGLKKYTPITAWTYLAACWAIAGFPWASGFYSKDEILWKAWTAEGLAAPWIGHAIYIVGAVAALGTSFYMFRSYYMTFTGEYRGGHGHEDHASHGAQPDDHGHGGEPHESPKSMTVVLQILAVAAVIGGVIFGWPAAWPPHGHEPALEKWLAPSLPAAELVKFAEPGHATEYLFQFFGLAIAGLGWIAARALYKDAHSSVPARLKELFPRSWALVYNKYYVDELYGATVVRGSLLLAGFSYWFDQNVIDRLVNFMGTLARTVAYVDKFIDDNFVDGAVNGIASITWNSGRMLRRLQTGHIQSYLYGALGGAIAFVIIQYVIR